MRAGRCLSRGCAGRQEGGRCSASKATRAGVSSGAPRVCTSARPRLPGPPRTRFLPNQSRGHTGGKLPLKAEQVSLEILGNFNMQTSAATSRRPSRTLAPGPCLMQSPARPLRGRAGGLALPWQVGAGRRDHLRPRSGSAYGPNLGTLWKAQQLLLCTHAPDRGTVDTPLVSGPGQPQCRHPAPAPRLPLAALPHSSPPPPPTPHRNSSE